MNKKSFHFKFIVLAIVFVLLLKIVHAQERTKALSIFKERPEIYIKFAPQTNEVLEEYGELMSIDKVIKKGSKNEVTAYLNKEQFCLFEKKKNDYEILTPPSLKATVSMCPDVNGVKNWDCYPTYEQYIELMQGFESEYPNLCKLEEFGQSVEGRKLLALKISDNPGSKEDEPEFLYTATIHGDETAGYVLMLRLIDYLLANYGTDTRITDLVNNTEIWINPLSNPDGTYYSSDYNVNGATRSNSNGFDLNRNFPDPEDGEYPNGTRQPETTQMMEFLQLHNFVLSANFHGGAEVVNYPWDTWYPSYKKHADDLWYQEISSEYADTVHKYSSNYMVSLDGISNPSGITNGAAWYSISGGRQDYMNYYMHSREVTIEISMVKLAGASLLLDLWNYNYRSFLNYIERVHTGVYGKVTDNQGSPLRAKISLTDYDADSSEVYATASNGMYYRMLQNGNYHLVATLDGYLPAGFDITVSDNLPTELNITLQKDQTNIVGHNIPGAKIIRYQNPITEQLSFDLELEKEELLEMSLYDIAGNILFANTIKGSKGVNLIRHNTPELKKGVYFLRLYIGTKPIELKLVK